MCLISLLYVEDQGSVKFKSIYFLSEVGSCGTPGETFQGQGKSWNQEIIKAVCSQCHSKMRLKQKIQQSQQHLYLSRSRWESLEKRLQAGPWKTSCTATWIQTPVLWFDRDTSVSSVATFILFDVRMRNSSSHGRWKSPEFLPFLLCLTQGLGLGAHTKWENCYSAWLPSLNDGWRETKPHYYYFLLRM